ncbi:MAG: hypothetical protein ACOY7U_03135 [Acidobacteriota bacterium]|jgi:hypothetical protein|uniref:Uncharacterized protein n=1 Tax=Thermoanaerobaculum aquaticum TaxID=1312852 RepID=A0A062XYH7_9BACT|nr:hypothetical protein [Thermoanaerobaculum aquaticum]KDA54474.1 hypothetical protein EG19_12220 [Thermoanaerobaculum aquaticum]
MQGLDKKSGNLHSAKNPAAGSRAKKGGQAMKRLTQVFICAMAILLSLAASSQAVALPPGGDEIVTTTLFELANGSASARCLLPENLNSGAQWLIYSLTSSSGTISGVLNQAGQGTIVFPDGLLGIEIGSGGQSVVSLEPTAGPPFVMVISPNGSAQLSGDLAATASSMPVTFGPLGQALVGLGLDLGLVEPDPTGGFRPVMGVDELLFGAGHQRNKATAKTATWALAFIGTGYECFRLGAGCLGFPVVFNEFVGAWINEHRTCLNISN